MAKNKQPLKLDLEEGSQEMNTFSVEPKLVSDQDKKPINETECDHVKFLWPYSDNNKYCCIYRVPCRLRKVNPEAYTPQMLLIGPLQHSKKVVAAELSKTDMRYMDYMKMEQHKEMYLQNFTLTYGHKIVEEFKTIIKKDEKIIRACYAESTDCINSHDFVQTMLLDSVFILVFFLQLRTRYAGKTGDFIFDAPSNINTISEDLILLENQLPYFLLENLFEQFLAERDVILRDFILERFELKNKIKKEVKFLHFTDLLRCARVERLGVTETVQSNKNVVNKKPIKNLHSAYELRSKGVKFVVVEEEKNTSLMIKFEHGILTMPCFSAEDSTEMVLRNIMALEQCHYTDTAIVCDYIFFLDFLIDTEQDVNFLVRKEVIRNWLGHEASIAEMVNKLCLGLVDYGSHYYEIAESLNNHCKSRLNRSVATLRRVYFKDLWTGTATVAAIIILILTLIGSVASVLQVTQKDNKSPPPSPSARKP